ncbi:MAG: hypothetical protein ABI232_12965 [Jatrophihabitantaceae bacterium]
MSLLSGTQTVWVGVVVVLAATVGTFTLQAPVWLRVVAVVSLVLSIGSAVSDEVQLQQRREDLSRIFNSAPAPVWHQDGSHRDVVKWTI